MSKKDLWYIQLDVDDWGRDLDVHPIEIEGAWLRICRKLFYAPQRGRLTWSLERWALVLNVDKDEAKRICAYLFDEKIASGRFEHNGNVTLVSRRMMKDDKSRELNRLRQQSFRDKTKRNAPVTDMSRDNNAPCNADVTGHINIYSNSNINTKEEKQPPAPPVDNPQKPDINSIELKSIDNYATALKNENIFPNVFAFVGKCKKNKANLKAIVQTLRQCYTYKPDGPWAYCVRIMKKEDANFNERDYVEKVKEENKIEPPQEIKELTKGIG